MANPMTVGTTAIVAVPPKRNRAQVRFQNTGTTILYFIRQLGNSLDIPSPTNFEFALFPATAVFDANISHEEVVSIAGFNVVSSAAGGSLAIFETVKV